NRRAAHRPRVGRIARMKQTRRGPARDEINVSLVKHRQASSAGRESAFVGKSSGHVIGGELRPILPVPGVYDHELSINRIADSKTFNLRHADQCIEEKLLALVRILQGPIPSAIGGLV